MGVDDQFMMLYCPPLAQSQENDEILLDKSSLVLVTSTTRSSGADTRPMAGILMSYGECYSISSIRNISHGCGGQQRQPQRGAFCAA
jgi:hypothetical protein